VSRPLDPQVRARLATALAAIVQPARMGTPEQVHEVHCNIFKAVAHAYLYFARKHGLSSPDALGLIEGRQPTRQHVLSPSPVRLHERVGVVRLPEPQRLAVNAILERIYAACRPFPLALVVPVLARFLADNGPVIGMTREQVLHGLKNLDAILRQWGRAEQFIPVEQFGI
jgi:hypothetical protein